MAQESIEQIVHTEVQAYLAKIANSAETIARTHPEITLMQFAQVMKIAAADVDEEFNIDQAFPKVDEDEGL